VLNSPAMRIMVDLDGVVYPFSDVFLSYAGLPVMPASQWGFYKDAGFTDETFLQKFVEGVDAGIIFAIGKPIEGSLEGMAELRRRGHTLHLVTDRFVGKRSQENTERWLIEHEVPYDTLTYSRDKTIIRTDAGIDDKPSHVDALRLAGCHAFLFDRGRSDQKGHRRIVSDWPSFVWEVSQIGQQ